MPLFALATLADAGGPTMVVSGADPPTRGRTRRRPEQAEPTDPRWSRAFAGDGAAVGGVRRFVTEVVVDHLVASPDSALVDDLALVASELAANAVLHAGGGFHVTVALRPAVVRLEVKDGSDLLPCPRDPAPHQPGGRGCQIVDALAERWGCTKLPTGKSVWAEVRVGRS